MSNYTITTDFGAKDSLPSSNDSKVVRGSEFTTEFTNIQTAIATKADTAGDTFTGVVNFSADVAVNTNTLFVDVSEAKVGIGTTSPQAPLHVHGDINLGNNAGADAADVEIASLNFYNRDTSGSAPNNAAIIRAYSHSATGSGGYLTFATSFGGEAEGADATEKMRIDASGNLLVGTTDASVYDNTSGGNTGFVYSPNSFLQLARETNYRTQSLMNLNKMGADGNIIEFYKDGSQAGSIGTETGRLTIGSGDTGLRLLGDTDEITPWNTSTNAGRDALIDLGNANNRFKDLHLSGTGYFGTNVGIGTTSPASPLHVNNTVTASDSLSEGITLSNPASFTNNRLPAITWDYGATGTPTFAAIDTSRATGTGGNLLFHTASTAGSLTERMRIDSTGNLGIGTNSPDSLMHLSANTGATLTLESTDTAIAVNEVIGEIDFYSNDASGIGAASRGSISLIAQDAAGAGSMLFKTSNASTASTEHMRIDSSGNVGIGTDSPVFKLDVAGNARASYFALRSNETVPSESSFIYRPDTGVLGFGTGTEERMRIDSSGNVLVDTASTNATGGGFSFRAGSVNYMNIAHASSVGHGNYFVAFKHDDSVIGTITKTQTTGVSYNTSSDERLKENIADSADAGSKVDAIQIRQFDWKADGSHQDYGVIAQELATVAPEAVHQPEDSEEMMGVDYSKLVPMLIKEVQSLRSRVAELENA